MDADQPLIARADFALLYGFNEGLRAMVRQALFLSLWVVTVPAQADTLCGYDVSSIGQMVGTITKSGGRVILETADFVAVEEPRRLMLWTFAKPKAGQFPAFICRQVVQTNEQVQVELKAVCKGAKPYCDALIASVLDQQQKATQHLRP